MPLTKRIIWFIIFQTLSIAATAQKGAIVQGVVTDSLGLPLNNVNVRLVSLPDSFVVYTALSDKQGVYEFDRVMPGRYLVLAKLIGYHAFYASSFSVAAETITCNIRLRKENTLLREVEVIESQLGVVTEPGKVVLNLEKDILAAGGNVLDALKRAPGVNVGSDGSIQIKGRDGVAVMLDGRMLTLSPAEVSETLRNLSADLVERVEVFSTPSASYDASGRGGVISIRLKKSKRDGTNGSLSLAGGLGENYKMNGSAILNHRSRHWNFFGSLSGADNRRADRYQMNRQIGFMSGKSDFAINNYDLKSFKNLNIKTGADISLGSAHTLGFLYTGLHNRMHSVETNNTSVYSSGSADSVIRTFSDEHRKISNDALNINYNIRFGDGSSFSFDTDYLKYARRSDETLNYNFLDANGRLYKDVNNLVNRSPSDISALSVKGDYKARISGYSISTGFKSSRVSNKNKREVYNAGDVWIKKSFSDDNSDFKEYVQAGYVNVSREYSKKLSAELGLRGEYTESTSSSLTKGGYRKTYFDLFPSLNVSVQLAQDHRMSVLYARRIARPAYDDLNPFRYFLDQYTYRDGNPDLRPEYSNTVELSDVYKEKLTATFSFTRVKDYYVTFTDQDNATGVSRSTKRNLSSMRGWGLELAYDLSSAAWLTSSLNVQGYLQRFDLGMAENVVRNGTSWSFSSVNSMKLKHGVNAQIVLKYESPSVSGMYDFKSGYALDVGLAKSLQGKRGMLRLSVSDLFNSDRERYSSNLPALTMRARQKTETRYGVLSYTYKFGSRSDGGAGRNAGNDAERKRISN